MTATTVPQTPEQREAQRWSLVARAKSLGWRGQNAIARSIRMDPGHFSRVMKGERVSRRAWEDAHEALTKAEKAEKRAKRKSA